ncbi:MAG TPA: hypothetical protein VNJ70_09675 [Thermoanaerobaculia bacterium]|nr:hypothetical protein [Thermoanaerobaculia bacterium]
MADPVAGLPDAASRVPRGAWTPSKAFGWRFVTELPGVVLGELRRT